MVSTIAFSWLAMMIVHEAGHVLHAVVSGGRVELVLLHPLMISRTDVQPNPHPHFVAWGGAVWGCALPIVAWLAARRAGLRSAYLFRFVAGFCLIANGAYLGAGVFMPVGDAADLLQQGTPRCLLGLWGVSTVSLGLWMWNGLGTSFGLGRSAAPIERRHAAAMLGASVAICVVEVLLFGSMPHRA